MSSEEAFQLYGSSYLPGFCQFETGTKCNTSCIMCAHRKMKPRPDAKWSTLTRIIDTVIPTATSCCPFLMQEPLTEPRLLKILNNIKVVNPQCSITVYTNMALMNHNYTKAIIDQQRLDKLAISFYGPTEKIYNKVQPGLDWEQTKQNIRGFIKYRDEKGYTKPSVEMHYIVMPLLAENAETFFNEWRGVVDAIYYVHYDNFHGDMPSLPDELQRKYWGEPNPERLPCSRLWKSFNVLSNGDVVPCCIDYDNTIPLSNIMEDEPHDIWRGAKMEKLRQMHIERRFDEIPLCRDCTVWRYEEHPEWINLWSS